MMTQQKKSFSKLSLLNLIILLFTLQACTHVEKDPEYVDPSRSQYLYLECQQAIKESSNKRELEESTCTQKIGLFLLGWTYASLAAPVPEDMRQKFFEDNYKSNQHIYACARKEGYVVTDSLTDDKTFVDGGVNFPATFIKWVEKKPDERLTANMGEAVLAAFAFPCESNKPPVEKDDK